MAKVDEYKRDIQAPWHVVLRRSRVSRFSSSTRTTANRTNGLGFALGQIDQNVVRDLVLVWTGQSAQWCVDLFSLAASAAASALDACSDKIYRSTPDAPVVGL